MSQATSEPPPLPAAGPSQGVQVHEVELPAPAEAEVQTGGGQIDILLDTAMTVSACLGGVTLPIRQLLQLGPGSVLTLDRQVGEPLDLYLREIRFATGHLVVVGDRLAIRIKEVLPSTIQ